MLIGASKILREQNYRPLEKTGPSSSNTTLHTGFVKYFEHLLERGFFSSPDVRMPKADPHVIFHLPVLLVLSLVFVFFVGSRI